MPATVPATVARAAKSYVPNTPYGSALYTRPAANRPSTGARHTETLPYFAASSGRKSVWTFVRQLRGPHLSTCA
jgi:hypothetical protein